MIKTLKNKSRSNSLYKFILYVYIIGSMKKNLKNFIIIRTNNKVKLKIACCGL